MVAALSFGVTATVTAWAAATWKNGGEISIKYISWTNISTKHIILQWNFVIKRSDIIKHSYSKIISLVPAL